MRKNLWLALALVLIIPAMFFQVSCAKNAVQSQSDQTDQSTPPTAQDSSTGNVEPQADAAPPQATGGEFINDNINFAFDSAVLTDKAQRILADKADYLRSNPGLAVTVEGHCDSRGTAAYNMALGERRAKSAKDFLMDMGIGTDRLSTVSYGEERPLAQGQDELSWSKNRRAQFVIK